MPVINFAGLASGIDSTALIKAQSDASRKQRIEPLEKKVSELEETNTALEELRTKLRTLQTKGKDFTTLSGGGLAKTSTSGNEAIATSVPTSAATSGIYSVNITQKAKNSVLSFNDRFTSTSTAIKPTINDAASDADRTVTFTVGSGGTATAVPVVMTSTMTPTQFVEAFNSATTKAQASLVNVGTSASPSYAIMVSSGKEGTAEGQLAVVVGAQLSGAPAALSTHTLDAATDAQFTVSGITGTITRSTNNVSDVIPGLTIEIQGTGSTSITVKDDVSTTTTKVQELVDSYNEIVKFLAENNTIEREENGTEVENIFGPLAGTRTDDNALQSIRSALTSSSYSGGTEIKMFADLGITTERDGTLKFDTATFQSAMAKEPSSVNAILKKFADTSSMTGGSIDLLVRFNGLLDVSVNSNKTQIIGHNDRIADAEEFIAKQEDTLRQRFARLEATVGRLQNQQGALTSALAGLQRR